jgi:hypothetical protein
VVTVFRMSEQVSSQPPDHEAEAHPAAEKPQVDHPADEPKAEAGKPEPETPKPRWWRFWRRQSEQSGGPESRFSILTALISAAAALIGAAFGGIASYAAAQSQADAQSRVAQANNTAQASQALITRQQIAYSDYIAAEDDLEVVELRFRDAVAHFRPPNIDPIVAVFKEYGDVHTKWLHVVDKVELVSSPKVDQALYPMVTQQRELSVTVTNFENTIESDMPKVDQSALDDFVTKVNGLTPLGNDFIAAGKSDISG